MTEIIIDSYQYFISDEQFNELKPSLEKNNLIIKFKESSNRYYLNIDHGMFEDVLSVLRGNKLELKQFSDVYRKNLLRLSEILKMDSLRSQIKEYYENKDSDCQYLYNKTLNILKRKAVPFNEKIYESISNVIDFFYSLSEKNMVSDKHKEHFDSLIQILFVSIPDKLFTDNETENEKSVEFKSNEVYPPEERASVHLEDLKSETINRISQNDDEKSYEELDNFGDVIEPMKIEQDKKPELTETQIISIKDKFAEIEKMANDVNNKSNYFEEFNKLVNDPLVIQYNKQLTVNKEDESESDSLHVNLDSDEELTLVEHNIKNNIVTLD